MRLYIDYSPIDDCRNTEKALNEPCNKCNKCGRYSTDKKQTEALYKKIGDIEWAIIKKTNVK